MAESRSGSSALSGKSTQKDEYKLDVSELQPSTSRRSLIGVIVSLSCTSLFNSISLGIIMIATPQMVQDLKIDPDLALWAGTVNSLALGCCLIPAGMVADIIGCRKVALIGTFGIMAFTLGCGLARDTVQLLAFRTLAGVSAALFKPSAVSIISNSIPRGRMRNIGFSWLGASMPLGTGLGSIIGGTLESTAGSWRSAFYLCAGALLLFLIANFVFIPPDAPSDSKLVKQLCFDVDWVGALIFGVAFALLSVSMALISGDTSQMRRPVTLVTLILGTLLLPAFFGWMRVRQASGRKCLIPNGIWKNKEFVALCLMILFAETALNSMEWVCSLFFQDIQNFPPLDAAIRFLPVFLFGIVLQILVGAYVQHIAVTPFLVTVASVTSVPPIIMALIDPSWSYWRGSFWAMLLLPTAIDGLFTIGTLIITDLFPQEQHALASAVFNVVDQSGQSLGLTLMTLILSSLNQNGDSSSDFKSRYSLASFHVAFWVCFGLGVATIGIAAVGFRRRKYVGKVPSSDSEVTLAEA